MEPSARALLSRIRADGVGAREEDVRAWRDAGCPPAVRVVGAALWRDGRLLAAQRASGQLAGCWELPGGKVEPGETPQVALERELVEELGVRVRAGEELAAVHWLVGPRALRLAALPVALLEGEPRALEHAALRWIAKVELDQLAWAPADVPLLDVLVRCWPG